MQIPEEINIYGQLWRVTWKDGIDYEGTKAHGTCSYIDKEICLDKNMDEEIILETFLHEYFHAVWYGTGLDDQSGVHPFVEHMYIVPLSKQMAMAPQFWEALFSEWE